MKARPIVLKIVLAAAALVALPAFSQQDFSKVQIKTQRLSDSVYMLTGEGGNLGLSAGPDAVFLIDDQFAPLTPRIKAAIARITKKPVKFVLNTHWHFDHVGGNENLGKGGAVIFAHENVRKRMSSEQFTTFLGMKTPPSPHAALPVVTFASWVSFHVNGEEVRALHVENAHTDGDVIVHFTKSDVIHTGDVFFNKLYPFIDTSSGGSVDGVIAAADFVLNMAGDKTKIIPGHGPLGNKADLKAYRDMLATVSRRVKEQIGAGKKLDAIVAVRPSFQYDAVWGKGFLPPDKFVAMLYENLTRK